MAASLTSEMLPDTLLVAVGANCTLKVLDCAGGRVSGKVSPLMLKPAPVELSCPFVHVALPDSMTWGFVVVAVTLPKLMFEGFGMSWLLAGWVPLPAREIVLGEMAASLTSETLPD